METYLIVTRIKGDVIMCSILSGFQFGLGFIIAGVVCFLLFLLFLEIMVWIRRR